MGRLTEDRVEHVEIPLLGVNAGFLSAAICVHAASIDAPSCAAVLQELGDDIPHSQCQARSMLDINAVLHTYSERGLAGADVIVTLVLWHVQIRIERAQGLPRFKLYKKGLLTAVRLRQGEWQDQTPVALRSYKPEWQSAFCLSANNSEPLTLELCRRSKLQGLKVLASASLNLADLVRSSVWSNTIAITGHAACVATHGACDFRSAGAYQHSDDQNITQPCRAGTAVSGVGGSHRQLRWHCWPTLCAPF